jgi:hypothetical protein
MRSKPARVTVPAAERPRLSEAGRDWAIVSDQLGLDRQRSVTVMAGEDSKVGPFWSELSFIHNFDLAPTQLLQTFLHGILQLLIFQVVTDLVCRD